MDSCSSIFGTTYGKLHGYEGGRSEETITANNNSISGRLSIGNDTTSPGKSSGKRQEECQPIIDDSTSIVRNDPIREKNYKYPLAQ